MGDGAGESYVSAKDFADAILTRLKRAEEAIRGGYINLFSSFTFNEDNPDLPADWPLAERPYARNMKEAMKLISELNRLEGNINALFHAKSEFLTGRQLEAQQSRTYEDVLAVVATKAEVLSFIAAVFQSHGDLYNDGQQLQLLVEAASPGYTVPEEVRQAAREQIAEWQAAAPRVAHWDHVQQAHKGECCGHCR